MRIGVAYQQKMSMSDGEFAQEVIQVSLRIRNEELETIQEFLIISRLRS